LALPRSSAASLRDADQPRRNATVVDGALWTADSMFSVAEIIGGVGR